MQNYRDSNVYIYTLAYIHIYIKCIYTRRHIHIYVYTHTHIQRERSSIDWFTPRVAAVAGAGPPRSQETLSRTPM